MSAFGDYDAGTARARNRERARRWQPPPGMTPEQRARRQREQEERTVTTKDGKKIKLPKEVQRVSKGLQAQEQLMRAVREQVRSSEDVLMDLEERHARREARDQKRSDEMMSRIQRAVG